MGEQSAVNQVLELSAGQAVTIRRRSRGVWLVCLEGHLWITDPADRADLILGEGERRFLPPRRGTVVSAIGPSRAVLQGQPRSPALFRAPTAACADC